MILIADSGSTKTEWIIGNNKSSNKIHTQGMNPYFISPENMREILQSTFDELTDPIDEISLLWFRL